MNLLFDQNISFKITTLLTDAFPDCKQVRELHLENSSDIALWNYARDNKFCIVTFDSDFIDISNLRGSPPKVIWLRFGNTTTKNIATKMIEQKAAILDFLFSEESSFLELN